jgi:DNA-binding CsgD family transcriptional regulator
MVAASVHERIAHVLPELYVVTPIEEYPARALSLVRRVVGGDKADYTEFDLETRAFRVLVDPQPPTLGDLAAARAAHMREHPVLAHVVADPNPGVRLISDFLTQVEFHRLGLYREFFAHLGVEDQLTAVVSRPTSRCLAGISVDRDRRSFDERDRLLLELLQPHLVAARRNAEAFSAALAAHDGPSATPQEPAPLDRLTTRQREILAQLASGRTNAQIALALDISNGTVRKHVEHILRRMNLATRTAAAVAYATAPHGGAAPRWTAMIASFAHGVPEAGEQASKQP